MPRTIYTAGRTSLVERLKARECELCGATDDLVMHHVSETKELAGKGKLGTTHDCPQTQDDCRVQELSQEDT